MTTLLVPSVLCRSPFELTLDETMGPALLDIVAFSEPVIIHRVLVDGQDVNMPPQLRETTTEVPVATIGCSLSLEFSLSQGVQQDGTVSPSTVAVEVFGYPLSLPPPASAATRLLSLYSATASNCPSRRFIALLCGVSLTSSRKYLQATEIFAPYTAKTPIFRLLSGDASLISGNPFTALVQYLNMSPAESSVFDEQTLVTLYAERLLQLMLLGLESNFLYVQRAALRGMELLCESPSVIPLFWRTFRSLVSSVAATHALSDAAAPAFPPIADNRIEKLSDRPFLREQGECLPMKQKGHKNWNRAFFVPSAEEFWRLSGSFLKLLSAVHAHSLDAIYSQCVDFIEQDAFFSSSHPAQISIVRLWACLLQQMEQIPSLPSSLVLRIIFALPQGSYFLRLYCLLRDHALPRLSGIACTQTAEILEVVWKSMEPGDETVTAALTELAQRLSLRLAALGPESSAAAEARIEANCANLMQFLDDAEVTTETELQFFLASGTYLALLAATPLSSVVKRGILTVTGACSALAEQNSVSDSVLFFLSIVQSKCASDRTISQFLFDSFPLFLQWLPNSVSVQLPSLISDIFATQLHNDISVVMPEHLYLLLDYFCHPYTQQNAAVKTSLLQICDALSKVVGNRALELLRYFGRYCLIEPESFDLRRAGVFLTFLDALAEQKRPLLGTLSVALVGDIFSLTQQLARGTQACLRRFAMDFLKKILHSFCGHQEDGDVSFRLCVILSSAMAESFQLLDLRLFKEFMGVFRELIPLEDCSPQADTLSAERTCLLVNELAKFIVLALLVPYKPLCDETERFLFAIPFPKALTHILAIMSHHPVLATTYLRLRAISDYRRKHMHSPTAASTPVVEQTGLLTVLNVAEQDGDAEGEEWGMGFGLVDSAELRSDSGLGSDGRRSGDTFSDLGIVEVKESWEEEEEQPIRNRPPSAPSVFPGGGGELRSRTKPRPRTAPIVREESPRAAPQTEEPTWGESSDDEVEYI